ncbi:MAG TPA: cytochrome c [Candidatus Deferrimicrobium sp.]|nr:cytochrome c [Candidatus Deferrimicrobium sp.]
MKTAICISGVLLFISFLLILQDDFNQQWKQVQQRFATIDENRFYSADGDAYAAEPGVKQIVVSGLDRVDRCTTCHLGVQESKYAHAVAPFTTHPGDMLRIHDPKEFGCTACHLGQGYAVSFETAAHEKLEFWNETMLPRELLQATCGTCHLSEEVPAAPQLTRGRLLIRDKGCSGCHDLNNFFEDTPRGPDLEGIGNKTTPAWLYQWLKNPRAYLKDSRMPAFRLSDHEIVSLMEFLMSLNTKDSPPRLIKEQPSEEGNEDDGGTLVSESRCISCHAIHGRGGKLAPELERVGDKVREEWLANFLRNVHYYQPEKVMLEYNFTDRNALDIAAYVLGEFSEEAYELPDSVEALLPRSESQRKDRIEQGRKLMAKYGCDGCHTISGKRLSPRVGPKLTNIGSRLESTLDFGKMTDVVPTLYNWMYMKVKQPAVFDSTSIMPDFHLTDREALEITLALLGNRELEYSEEYLVRESERSLYRKPAGAFGELFERYSCISCHSIDKYGGDISTAPLTIEGSKVQYEWLKDYLLNPSAIRPLLAERMPRFRMTEREAALMADYIKKVYVSDDIPGFFEYELTSQSADAGRRLFMELGCRSCHIVEKTGGYVGPQLDDVGDRLEAGWLFSWLRSPLTYNAETIHPDYGFSEEQAKQLTAYLMTKRGAQ